MNVLRWCPFVHLFDKPFQNSPYGHVYVCICMYITTCYSLKKSTVFTLK